MKKYNYQIINCTPITVDEDIINRNKDAKFGDIYQYKFKIATSIDTYCIGYLYTNKADFIPRPYLENTLYRINKSGEDFSVGKIEFARMNDEFYIAMIEYAKDFIPDMKEWCKSVLKTYNTLKTQIEQSNFLHSQQFILSNKNVLNFVLCSQLGNIESFDDIEFYLVNNSMDINSCDYLSILACNITNEELTKKENESSKEYLISYYKDNDLESLLKKPYEQQTDEEAEILQFFSDYHKDVFGYRPRGESNAVQEIIDLEENSIYDSFSN